MTKRGEQNERFHEAAYKAGADTSDDALDRVFSKLDLKRKPDADDDAEAPPEQA